MNIEAIFPNGEWQDNGEYLIRCPYCGDHRTHNHCSLNIDKGVFHCFFCGEGGGLGRMIREFGDGLATVEQFAPRVGIIEKEKHPRIDFSLLPKVTGIGGSLDRMAFTYLKRRGLTKDLIEQYDVRYGDVPDTKYYGRVIFPIYEDGRVVCFSARSYLPFVEPKYLFPRTGETLLTTSEAVFGWDRAMRKKRAYYILVEGVLDVVAVDAKLVKCNNVLANALALMSSYLSDGQLYKLLRLPRTAGFIVLLDADAHKEGYRVAKKLDAYGRAVKIALLKKGDPASVSTETLRTVLDASQELSFDLEMQIMMEAK